MFNIMRTDEVSIYIILFMGPCQASKQQKYVQPSMTNDPLSGQLNTILFVVGPCEATRSCMCNRA